ncbi:MAG: VTT domain-containing protein [Fuerstiella sp.]
MKTSGRLALGLTFIALLAMLIWSWSTDGVVQQLLGGDHDAESRIQFLKQYLASFGNAAPMVYVLFVVVEVVVAPIPGLMLYAPGGIVFGPFLGGALSLIGNIIGAGLASFLSRSFGAAWLTQFFDAAKLEKSQQALERQGALLIFLLRLNPLTSSDIVSYAAGFSRIPIWKIMFATGLGMAPLCFLQAWLAESLIVAFPGLLYPLLIACLVYVVVVGLVVRRMLQPSGPDTEG